MPTSERIARLLVLPLAVLFGILLYRGSGAPDPATTAGVQVPTTSGSDATTGSQEVATSTTAAPSSAPSASAPTTTASTTPDRADPTATTGPGVSDLPPADTGSPAIEPTGTFDGDRLVLGGSVPAEATADAYVRKLAPVFGADKVTVRMTLDQRVSADTLRIDVAQSFRFPDRGAPIDASFEFLLVVSTKVLAGLPGSKLVLTGHTDSVGTEATNLTLSIAGARLMADALVERGIAPERIAARGAGESQPVASNVGQHVG